MKKEKEPPKTFNPLTGLISRPVKGKKRDVLIIKDKPAK
jgi:hypothetical protein